MFNNRMLYTQSPGGVRRGLIWQSSNMDIRREGRNFIVDPYSITFGPLTIFDTNNNNKNLYTPSDTYVAPDDTIVRVQGIRPPYLHAQNISYPDFPYITQIDYKDGAPYFSFLADQYAFECEIDMYVYPDIIANFAGGSNHNPVSYQDFTYYKSSDSSPVTLRAVHNSSQLNRNQSGSSFGYVMKTSGNPDSNVNELTYPMCASPSLPMRIKGTLIYCDYPYAVASDNNSSDTAARGNIIDPIAPTQFFSNLLSQKAYPSLSLFDGSKINSPNEGNYYALSSIPSFQMDQRVRYDTTSSQTSNIQNWIMTKGTHYEGLNQDYQFFFSPICYPHSVYQGGLDSYCTISSAYGTHYDETNFLRHENPVFMSPIMNLPRANRVYSENIKEGPSQSAITYSCSLHPHRRALQWTSGNNQHSYGASFWNNSDFPFRPELVGSAVDPSSVLMPYGYSVGPLTVVNNILFNNTDVCLQWSDESILQPRFFRGNKYTVNVCPEIARHHFSARGRNTSGRYKYCGFKGTVSFFEMPNN